MTNQEAFARMVLHLRQQGRKSVESRGGIDFCRYRTKDGSRCAVGVLITDEMYRPEMEEQIATGGFGGYDVRNLLLKLGVNPAFAQIMQGVHDGVKPSQWEENFQAVAEAFNLTLPAPGQEHLYIPSPCAELAEQVPA